MPNREQTRTIQKKASKGVKSASPAERKRASAKAATGDTSELDQITTADEWAASSKPRVLTVPSGKKCLVRKPDGLKMFVGEGFVPNELMGIVNEALEGNTESAEKVGAEMMADPEKMLAMTAMVDAVVVSCVIKPEVAPVPRDSEGNEVPPHERPDDSTLYVDYIEFGDKMFIMNYAMSGVMDVEQFRQETEGVVSALEEEQGVEHTA